MAGSSLVLHRGAREVPWDELSKIDAPPATGTWFPVRHATVVDTVLSSLTTAGFEVRRGKYALSRDDHRMFATLDLATPLAGGEVTLAVGIRNSTDKSLPLGFCAGSRVFLCDNLAMRSELLVNRKHTRFGADRFQEAICQAVQLLAQFKESESARIRKFQHLAITDVQADSLMLRAFEQDIVSVRQLPRLIHEWRQPSFEDFEDRTFWSIENAFTSVLADVLKANPQRFCSKSIALQGLLAEAAGLRPEETFVQNAA